MAAKRVLTGIIVAAIAACGLGASWYFNQGENHVRLPGIVEIQEVRLSSKVGGRVKQVHVQEGMVVSPGQPLILFDIPEWEAKRAQLQAQEQVARAQLQKARNGALLEEKAAARATLAMSKARLLRLKNGSRPEEVEALHREWVSLKAQEDKASKDWQREQYLHGTRSGTQADADAVWSAFAKTQAQAKAAYERWKLAEKGPRTEEIAEADAEVAKMQAQVDLLQRGTRPEEIAEAEARVREISARLQEIDVQLREGEITAPDKALVEVIAVRRGDTVAPNQPVVRVLLAEDLWVKAYVSEPDLGKVHLRQDVFVSNDSFPGKKFKGTITYIASTSEFTPRNVQSADERRNQVFALKVRVIDTDGVFKSGMAAEVFIPLLQK